MAGGAATRAPDGIWLKIAKKGSGVASVTHAEALELALCFGWIDACARLDETSSCSASRRGGRAASGRGSIATRRKP